MEEFLVVDRSTSKSYLLIVAVYNSEGFALEKAETCTECGKKRIPHHRVRNVNKSDGEQIGHEYYLCVICLSFLSMFKNWVIRRG